MELSESTTATAGPQPTRSDTQTLVTLLGNLLPLLVRLQSQAEPHPMGSLGFVRQGATLDDQAAIGFVEDMIADRLRAISSYLDTHSKQHAGLEACTQLVTQAVQRYMERDYNQAFQLVWHAYRSIVALRSIDPQLPPLKPGGPVTGPMSSRPH